MMTLSAPCAIRVCASALTPFLEADDSRTGEVIAETVSITPEEDYEVLSVEKKVSDREPIDRASLLVCGGRGIKGLTTRDEDIIRYMFVCSSHDQVMFFTNMGRVYKLKCFEIPEGSRTAKGVHINNLLPLEEGEWVTTVLAGRR